MTAARSLPPPPPLPRYRVHHAAVPEGGATVGPRCEKVFISIPIRPDVEFAITSGVMATGIAACVVLMFRRPGSRKALGRIFIFKDTLALVRRAIEVARTTTKVGRTDVGWLTSKIGARTPVWARATENGSRAIVFARPGCRPVAIDDDCFTALETALRWLADQTGAA